MNSMEHCCCSCSKTGSIPAVFTTKSTLNERFGIGNPRPRFLIRNAVYTPSKDSSPQERVIYNRRSEGIHKRFRTNKQMDETENRSEGMKELEFELLRLARMIRKMVPPRSEIDSEKSRGRVKAIEGNQNNYCCNASSTSLPCETESDRCNMENIDHTMERFSTYKRSWTDKIKSSHSSSDVDRNTIKKNGNYRDTAGRRCDSAPFVCFGSSTRNARIPLWQRKWKKPYVSKEELDDDMDRYMAERKRLAHLNQVSDIDSFVEEYVLETKKCQQQNGIIIID